MADRKYPYHTWQSGFSWEWWDDEEGNEYHSGTYNGKRIIRKQTPEGEIFIFETNEPTN